MIINLSNEVINAVCISLNDSRRNLEWQLNRGIPCEKVKFDRKEIIQNQLSDAKEALQVFEELANNV